MNETEDIGKESFNEEFCSYLEYHLTRTFAHSTDKLISKIWCDGIQIPFVKNQISKKSVNDKRKIITKAWIGSDGQEEYELIVKFGKYSLKKYVKGSNLEDCVPGEESMDWINIDLDRQIIEMQLL